MNLKVKREYKGKPLTYEYEYKQIFILPEAQFQLRQLCLREKKTYSDVILELLSKKKK